MKKIILPVLLVGCLTSTCQQSNDVVTTGPESGTLVVVGGGRYVPEIWKNSLS
ncbi:MAG: hypothetical protein ABJP45_04255 [Cyclobacteriaceae bacterium]